MERDRLTIFPTPGEWPPQPAPLHYFPAAAMTATLPPHSRRADLSRPQSNSISRSDSARSGSATGSAQGIGGGRSAEVDAPHPANRQTSRAGNRVRMGLILKLARDGVTTSL